MTPTFSIDLWPLEGLMLANFVMEFASEPFPDLRMYICIRYKGGRSTKKFRSSEAPHIANPQICGLKLLICDLRSIYFLGFADLRFSDIFCGLKTSANPQIHHFYPYKYKIKCSHSSLWTTFAFGSVLSYMAFRSLKYTYVGKKNY
jgi:hypothetical protein